MSIIKNLFARMFWKVNAVSTALDYKVQVKNYESKFNGLFAVWTGAVDPRDTSSNGMFEGGKLYPVKALYDAGWKTYATFYDVEGEYNHLDFTFFDREGQKVDPWESKYYRDVMLNGSVRVMA